MGSDRNPNPSFSIGITDPTERVPPNGRLWLVLEKLNEEDELIIGIIHTGLMDGM